MKKQILTLFIALTAIFASAQKTIGDVKVDAKLAVEGQNLTLNGAGVRAKIDMFKGFFKEKINKKDIFIIVYVPGEGVSVLKNGVKKGTIDGLDFKKALFGIWLGNKPADDDLKAGMLGK
jgi:hypothetical protein